MGLKDCAEWKKFFKKTFVPKTDNDTEYTCTVKGDFLLQFGEKCLIIDASVLFHEKFNSPVVETWEMFYSFYRKSIIGYLNKSNVIERLIICIDNPFNVPINKSITQEKRNGNCKILTEEQIKLIREKIGIGTITNRDIDMDIKDLKSSIVANRNLKCEIHGWLWKRIISEGLLKNVRLIVDSVKYKDIKEIFKKTPDKQVDDEAFVTLDIELGIKSHKLNSIDYSRDIGEGEIKAIYYLTKETISYGKSYSKEKNSVTLISKDTDVIILILLCIVDLIDKNTGKIPVNIYLFDGIEIWNMCMLWRWIFDWFDLPRNERFNTRTPIETLALLAILNGTDYTINIKSIGFKTLMEYYFQEGYKCLGSSVSKLRDKDEIVIDDQYGSNLSSSYTIQTNTTIGGYNIERTITVDVQRFISFICGITKKTQELQKDIIMLENMYRRIVWVLGYWINSPKHIERHKPLDPLNWGWKLNEDGKIVMK